MTKDKLEKLKQQSKETLQISGSLLTLTMAAGFIIIAALLIQLFELVDFAIHQLPKEFKKLM